MGGKGGKAKAGPGEKELAAGSAELRDLLRPLREQLTGLSESVLGGGLNQFFGQVFGTEGTPGAGGGGATPTPAAPQRFSMQDLYETMRSINPGKTVVLPKLFKGLDPAGSYTAQELMSAAGPMMGKITKNSKAAVDQMFARINSQSGPSNQQGQQNAAISTLQPLVGGAIERSKSASSKALMGLDEGLFTSGLQNTPFGQTARAQTELAGLQDTAAIPGRFLESFLNLGNSMAFGAPLNAQVSGAGQAASIEGNRNIANAQIAAQSGSDLMSSLMQAGVAIGSAPMTGGGSIFASLGSSLAGMLR